VLEATLLKFLPNELRRPLNIALVLGERADAGYPEERLQTFEIILMMLLVIIHGGLIILRR
jgi:hypothetical protein